MNLVGQNQAKGPITSNCLQDIYHNYSNLNNPDIFKLTGAAKQANMVLGQLARGISYGDRKTFIRLYEVFVLPHLCYSVSALATYTVDDKEVPEKVQRREVMMVTNLRGSFEERLPILGMRTLEARRLRGDLIETYNILAG